MTGTSAPYGVTHLKSPAGQSQTWWSNYAHVLAESGISSTSLKVIDADSDYIVEECVLRGGVSQLDGWPESRERSGIVMGAVQSGKTASMLAVIAKALDRGVNAAVILAGTRTTLWLQTLARTAQQLDTWDSAWSRRILIPSRAILLNGGPAADLETLYALQKPRVKKALENRIPIIAVVMKNVFHLERASMTLHKTVYPLASNRSSPFHLLVIDDEADDSSILDAVAEARAGTSNSETKQVPRRIADLWETRLTPGETSHSNLYATYVAYTATPQANFLQDPQNPLAARDFAVSLRTPGPDGSPDARSSSYRDPTGLRAWYMGGGMFYKTLSSVPLCRTDDSDEDILGNALRCFLVGSAVRLWRDPDRIGPATAPTESYSTASEATEGFSHVTSMLIHPSSGKDDHFDMAARVLAWADGSGPSEARVWLDRGQRELDVDGIERQLREEPEKWQYWIEEFSRAAEICQNELSLPTRARVPDLSEWSEIRRLILEEVVPGTRLAVINSDEAADDRPDFEPRRQDSGGWGPPPNHSTIFVSGNVMARGLTLEGLTTTLFTRASDTPLADTQTQMQRWFGYRGRFIELCRVFLTSHQLDLFSRYHEADEALRRDILSAMNAPGGAAHALTVLQGYNFAATGKIANLRSSSLWPGATPFVRHMNTPDEDTTNAETVATYFRDKGFSVVQTRDGHELGLVLEEDLDLLSTADLLDKCRYAAHGPGTRGPEAARWSSVSNHLNLLSADAAFPLYRAPGIGGGVDLANDSPYWIAAYLRLWHACLARNVPGFTTTDPPYGPWSLVDLGKRAESRPRFRIGLRFGSGPEVTGPLAAIGYPVRSLRREVTSAGSLASAWGARGAATQRDFASRYPGDEYFDYFARAETVPTSTSWGRARPPGEPGLLLFHPIDRGDTRCSLALGMSIPLGGPDQVAAFSTNSE